jgi:hypothetical protein
MKYRNVTRPIFRLFQGQINVPVLRRIVGGLGIALPVILLVWGLFLSGWPPLGSLSDYYSLRTRDAFVGILFVIGWVLFAYKGYEKMDNVAGNLACVFAMGVAIFPNSGHSWERIVHFSSAACLFLVLAFFSIFLFTKTEGSPKGFRPTVKYVLHIGVSEKPVGPMRKEKRRRNKIYITCGLLMLAFLILVGLYMLLGQDTALASIRPVLILEWLMIWTFGVSWLVKGEAMFGDRNREAGAIMPAG